jgi:hypothetical protein
VDRSDAVGDRGARLEEHLQQQTASRIVVIVPEMITDASGKFASAVPTA